MKIELVNSSGQHYVIADAMDQVFVADESLHISSTAQVAQFPDAAWSGIYDRANKLIQLSFRVIKKNSDVDGASNEFWRLLKAFPRHGALWVSWGSGAMGDTIIFPTAHITDISASRIGVSLSVIYTMQLSDAV